MTASGGRRRRTPAQSEREPVVPPADVIENVEEGAAGPPPNAAPLTVSDTVVLVEEAWQRFWSRVLAYPRTQMDEPIAAQGWTRKQMLAHVAGWHDITTERLIQLARTGQLRDAGDVDRVNARLARAAMGRTTGEVVESVEASYRRLLRQIQSLDDSTLARHAGWAAERIAGNTFEHYAEHEADLVPPAAPEPDR
jgi:hypothetical protein